MIPDLASQLRKQTPLRGFSLSREALIQLYVLMRNIAAEAAEIEISGYVQQPDQTDEQFNDLKIRVRDLFVPYVQIETSSGATVSMASEKIFEGSEFPSKISKIQFDTGHVFQTRANHEPKNRALVLLDFRDVASLGLTVQPAQETPNESGALTYGSNSSWVRASSSKIEEYFSNKKRPGMWLHKAGTYDLLLTTFGIVFVAWVLAFSVPRIDKWFAGLSPIYNYSGYIFVGILALRFFMFLFHYARLIWPVTELKGDNKVTVAHRFVWITIILAVLGNIITDLFF